MSSYNSVSDKPAKPAAEWRIFAAVGILVAYLASVVFEGFVLSTLWGWFIVPTFHLPALTIPVALGISVVVNLFTFKAGQMTLTSEKTSTLVLVIVSFVASLVALGMGWVLTLFM